jgi:hypothetical protein
MCARLDMLQWASNIPTGVQSMLCRITVGNGHKLEIGDSVNWLT